MRVRQGARKVLVYLILWQRRRGAQSWGGTCSRWWGSSRGARGHEGQRRDVGSLEPAVGLQQEVAVWRRRQADGRARGRRWWWWLRLYEKFVAC